MTRTESKAQKAIKLKAIWIKKQREYKKAEKAANSAWLKWSKAQDAWNEAP